MYQQVLNIIALLPLVYKNLFYLRVIAFELNNTKIKSFLNNKTGLHKITQLVISIF